MRVKSHKDNTLLEFLFYEDDMPLWHFGYKDGKIYLIDYWKNYNFDNW